MWSEQTLLGPQDGLTYLFEEQRDDHRRACDDQSSHNTGQRVWIRLKERTLPKNTGILLHRIRQNTPLTRQTLVNPAANHKNQEAYNSPRNGPKNMPKLFENDQKLKTRALVFSVLIW